MSDLSQSIHRILGIKLDPRRATLYDILGLKAFESDPNTIKQAVLQCIQKIKSFDPALDPQGAQQVASLVDRARKQLLDPAIKSAYDQKLKSATTASPVANVTPNSSATTTKAAAVGGNTTASETTRDDDELDAWFPSADPQAAFDLDRYIAKMAQANPNLVAVETVEAVEVESTSSVAVLEPPIPDPSPVISTLQQAAAPSQTNRLNPISQTPVRKTVRRRKDRTAWLYIGGFVLGSLAVLGVGAFLLKQSQDSKKQVTINEPPAPVIRNSNKPSVKPADSPKPNPAQREPGVAAQMDKFKLDATPAVAPEEDSKEEPTSENASVETSMEEDETVATNENEPSEASDIETEPMTEPMPEATTEMTNSEESPSEPEKGPLSADDRKILVAALKAARKAITDWDFDAFDDQIEIALPLAREAPYDDQLARLDQLGQLQRIAVEGLKTAISKLSSGETFKVMRNEVAFVEGNDEQIVVRAGGKNERHPLKTLPMGLALGLFDLALDTDAPQDVAARGVYLALHPKANKAMKQRSEELLKKASESDKIRKDLLDALRDKYE